MENPNSRRMHESDPDKANNQMSADEQNLWKSSPEQDRALEYVSTENQKITSEFINNQIEALITRIKLTGGSVILIKEMNNVFDITLDTEIHPFKLNPQKYTDDFAKITQKFNLPTALAIANELISYIQNPENKVFVKAQYIIPLLSKLKTIEEGNYLVIVKEEMSPDGKTPKISLERKVAPITEFASSHTDYLVGNGITTP